MKKLLSRDAVKYIAVVAMTLDHIAWYFLEFSSPLAQIFHIVGRITAPIMCCFIAQGYRYTSSKSKYAFRLFLFAVLAQIPWVLVHYHNWYDLDFNMLFTLLISLGVLCCTEIKNKGLKFISIFALFLVSCFCDWMFFAPLFTLVFYYTQDNEKKMYGSYAACALVAFVFYTISSNPFSDFKGAVMSTLFMLGLFLCIPLLMMCNGQKGRFPKFNKWFFYVYYPLHLGVIVLIQRLIFM